MEALSQGSRGRQRDEESHDHSGVYGRRGSRIGGRGGGGGAGGCSRVIAGPAVTREFEMAGFPSVQVSSALEVEVRRSDDYTVSVAAPERLFDYQEVEKSAGTLMLRAGSEWPGWFTT
jgi:hypothetical protein